MKRIELAVVAVLLLGACSAPKNEPHTSLAEPLETAEVDQMPRVVDMPGPQLTAELRALAPATVKVLFVVDANGAVVAPSVQSSERAALDALALDTVRKWRFEPARLHGVAVPVRMCVPIVFAQD